MKQAKVFFLLAVLILASIFCPLYLHMRQDVAYKKMMRKIEKAFKSHGAVVLTLDIEDQQYVTWRNNHEITYNGDYYDIIKTDTLSSGVVKVRAYLDEEERRFSEALHETVKVNHNLPTSGKNNSSVNLKLFLKDFIVPANQRSQHICSKSLLFSENFCTLLIGYAQQAHLPPQKV